MAPSDPSPPPCSACATGHRCVRHSPLFAELDDPPGIPAGERPRVYETPPALPHRRPRRVPHRPQTLDHKVQELERRLYELAASLALTSGA